MLLCSVTTKKIFCSGSILLAVFRIGNIFTWTRIRRSVQLDYRSGSSSFYVLYSTLLPLPPLWFHCVWVCWDRTQDCCNFGFAVRRSNYKYRSQLLSWVAFKMPTKKSFFFLCSWILITVRTVTSVFKDNKLFRSRHNTAGIKVFLIFWLVDRRIRIGYGTLLIRSVGTLTAP